MYKNTFNKIILSKDILLEKIIFQRQTIYFLIAFFMFLVRGPHPEGLRNYSFSVLEIILDCVQGTVGSRSLH